MSARCEVSGCEWSGETHALRVHVSMAHPDVIARRDEEIRRLGEAGVSAKETARRLGVSTTVVSKVRRRFGIKAQRKPKPPKPRVLKFPDGVQTKSPRMRAGGCLHCPATFQTGADLLDHLTTAHSVPRRHQDGDRWSTNVSGARGDHVAPHRPVLVWTERRDGVPGLPHSDGSVRLENGRRIPARSVSFLISTDAA